ncbi:MAG: sensor histidine kinase [Phormidesmis sp.]
MGDLLSLVQLYDRHYPSPTHDIAEQIEDVDLAFIQEDYPKLIASIEAGSTRVRDVVLSLRNFSRLDESDIKLVDIHEGIENTLIMLNHRLINESGKPIIQISRDYDNLPKVECYAGLLNQALMSILFNAIEALSRPDAVAQTAQPSENTFQPQITLRTTLVGNSWIKIAVANNGPSIPPEVQQQMFEPFFTTKPVGQGTGMGLSMAYQIVNVKHGGKLFCFSEADTDTEFVIQIPIKQS